MVKSLESVIINSSNPKKLADFYNQKLGIEILGEYEMGEKGEEAFEMGFSSGPGFYINQHSEIHEESHEPERILLNFEVDDIDEAVDKLKTEGVKEVQEKYHIEGYGYAATYADPDGNHFQVVQIRG